MPEAACAESQSARSAALRDKNAELINLDQYIPEVGNLYGWACRAVMLSKDEDFYRLAATLRQAGHFRVESLRNKNANQVYIVPSRFQKAYLIGIPFSFRCRKILQYCIVVNEYHINFRDQYGVVIEPRLHEQRLHFRLRGHACERHK